jgi:hypothetical protein
MWEKVVSQDVLVNKALIQLKSMRNGFLTGRRLQKRSEKPRKQITTH